MKESWSLCSTVLRQHSFKNTVVLIPSTIYVWIWTEIQSMLWHWTTYAMPNKPLQSKHQDKLVFSLLFCLDTLVFQWWHYHITEKCLALQAWVNSVFFHMLIKLLGIFTQSLGMSPFQITSRSLWSSPLPTFLHCKRANLLRMQRLEDTSAQWFLVPHSL